MENFCFNLDQNFFFVFTDVIILKRFLFIISLQIQPRQKITGEESVKQQTRSNQVKIKLYLVTYFCFIQGFIRFIPKFKMSYIL